MKLTVIVKPNAKLTRVGSWHDDQTVDFFIAKPATGDLANLELLNFMSKKLNVPKSSVYMSKGRNAKRKTVTIEAEIDISHVHRALGRNHPS